MSFFLQRIVLDVFINFLHCLKKRRRGKPRRRLRSLFFDLAAAEPDAVSLADRRQLSFFVIIVCIGLIQLFPAQYDDGLAVGDELLAGGGDDDAVLYIFVDRIKLRHVGLGNEEIYISLDSRQLIVRTGHRRRDDRVVRRNLAVVPGPALDAAVGPPGPLGQGFYLKGGLN